MKNVLVLCMSTLNLDRNTGELHKSTYQTESAEKDDSRIITGYGQLEPVPKMLMLDWKKEEKKLDSILVLTTTATTEKKNFMMKDGENEKTYQESAYDFFVLQIKEFCKENQLNCPEFVMQPMDENNISAGIVEAILKIRELVSKDKVDIYLDIHGGFRATQLVMQGIMSLLKQEGIETKKIYKVEYSGGKGRIMQDTETFQIFDFVSGMHEFLDYGRSESLKRYLESRPEPDMELSNIIQNISDAIQLCDMNAFDDALTQMNQWLNPKQQKKQDEYLMLFQDNIRKAYGVLLEENRTVVDKIRWCLKKDFIQQALTLIESQMPEEFFRYGIFSYDPERELDVYEDRKRYECVGEGDSKWKAADVVDRSKKAWEKAENYVFQSFAGENVLRWERVNGQKEFCYLPIESNSVNTYKRVPLTKMKWEKPVSLEWKYEGKWCRALLKLDFDKKVIADGKLLNRLIQLHMSLKNQRNKVNHAATSGERVTVEKMKVAIEAYTDMAEELIRQVK